MPLPLRTVTYDITRFTGVEFAVGEVFLIIRPSLSTTADGHIVPMIDERFVPDASGQGTFSAVPGDLGTPEFDYIVRLVRQASGVYPPAELNLGRFRVPVGDGPFDLADLIADGVPPAVTSYWRAITEAQYLEILDAADRAEAAAASAELAADDAASLATVASGAWQANANPPIAGVKALLDAAAPVSLMPQTVMLEKLRTDYTEFAVYTPMSANGIDWHRWYHTNRIGNSDNIGSPRLLCGARVRLYLSTVIPKFDENYLTGTEGQATTATQATTAGTATGTWTAPATVSGVTNVSYSTIVGDKRVYTVTGAERIVWRAVNLASNGGWVKVRVDVAGTEIGAGLYDVPLTSGTRLIKLNSSALTAGLCLIPLASGLTSGTTYTVTIEVDTTNPASGRAYDGGLQMYAAVAFNAVGIHGTAQSKTLSGAIGNLLFFSGQRVVYQVTNATRIDWNYIATTGSNTATFEVYNSVGALVTAGVTSSLATAAAQGAYTFTVATGLTRGTYYLHVRSSVTVTGTDQRIYDAGVTSYDSTTAGTVGTHSFDLDGQSRILSNYTTYGQNCFATFGNQEYATQFRKTTELASVVDESYFTGGVHNNETNPTGLVVTVDGAVVDYAGASQYATWTGSVIRIEFDQNILFQLDQSVCASLHWVMEYSAAGYSVAITDTITATAGAYAHVSYAAMINAPNGDTSVSVASGGQLSANIGGGLDGVHMDGWGVARPVAYDGSSVPISQRCSTLVRYNNAFAVACALNNRSEIDRAFDGIAPKIVGTWSSYNDRTDGTGKSYVRAFSGPPAAGLLRPLGHSYTSRKTYRAYSGAGVVRAAGLTRE